MKYVFSPLNARKLLLFYKMTLFVHSYVKEQKKDYIEFWCASNIFEVEFSKKVVEARNADSSHRQVRVQSVPEGQSSEEVILAAIVGKIPPDFYSNLWPGVLE